MPRTEEKQVRAEVSVSSATTNMCVGLVHLDRDLSIQIYGTQQHLVSIPFGTTLVPLHWEVSQLQARMHPFVSSSLVNCRVINCNVNNGTPLHHQFS